MSSTTKPGDVTGETSMTSSMSAGTTPGGAATTTLAETSGDPGSSVVEATLTLTVDDPTITENETVTNAMIQGFAEVMGVEASSTPPREDAPSPMLKKPRSPALQLRRSRWKIPTLLSPPPWLLYVAMGFAGTIEVTGKEAKIQDQGRPNAATVQNFTLAVLLGLAIPYFLWF